MYSFLFSSSSFSLPGAYIRGVDLPALSLSCSTPSGGRFSCYILSSFTSYYHIINYFFSYHLFPPPTSYFFFFFFNNCLPIGNMPTGRKLPPTFGIGLGSNPSPFGSCSTVYSYTTHFGTGMLMFSIFLLFFDQVIISFYVLVV